MVPHWLRWLPGGILVAVALLQVVLVHTSDLAPWSGGGFGMFSTTDAAPSRHLHAFAVVSGGTREVDHRQVDREVLDRALAFPTATNLAPLARAVATATPTDVGRPSAVRFEIWSVVFERRTLAPTGRLIHSVEIPLASE